MTNESGNVETMKQEKEKTTNKLHQPRVWQGLLARRGSGLGSATYHTHTRAHFTP